MPKEYVTSYYVCYCSSYDSNLQTLIPDVDMTNVNRLLNTSAANLKAEIISIMENFGLEQSMIDKARNSKPELLLNWSAAAVEISSAVYDTAYFRYVDWYNYKYNKKRKGATTHSTAHTTEVSGQSSQTITMVAPLASSSTERDSKKRKVSKEKNASSKKKK